MGIRGVLLSMGFLIAGMVSSPAKASCGLDACPLDVTGDRRDRAFLRMPVVVRRTQVAVGEQPVSYTETFVGAELRGLFGTLLGFRVPMVVLDRPDGRVRGLGNALGYGEWRPIELGVVAAGIGLQVELPTGYADEGLADAHAVALPYAIARADIGPLFAVGRVGYAQAFGGSSSRDQLRSDLRETLLHGVHINSAGEAVPVYVNPHAAGEVVYRLVGGFRAPELGMRSALFLDGQQIVYGGDGVDSTVALGAQVSWSPHPLVAGRIYGSTPITEGRRYLWQLGLGVTLRLG